MKNWKKEIISWVLMFAVAFALAFVITNYVVVNANIPSTSMEKTVMKGDRLLANRLAYRKTSPKRGDIVVFKYPVDESQLYIKRVIGLPNEKIEIINGKIYINGSSQPLEEDYLPEEWTVRNDSLSYEVPEGHYFMMGDNRNVSSDSRCWKNEALNKGIINTEGKTESEVQQIAEQYQFVAEEKILGKAFFRYWPITDMRTY